MRANRIVIVEDERIVALHLKQQLRRLGYEVPALATSGATALRAIEQHRPDLVLMDIHIEGEIDGIETAARIPPDLDVPVVYLTAYSDEATLTRARATKPFGYLVKPFSERELHATIQMVMERQRTEAGMRAYGKELEELVASRTAALSTALRRLESEVAERELAEQALRQAQKMEAVGQLTGGVAHDFNNLLTVVRGSLELINNNPADVARVLRLTRNAVTAVERCERLIQQLLMFSRRQVLFPEVVDANKLLSEFQPLLERALGTDVEMVVRLRPALTLTLVDATQFQSAILNLVINAREAITRPQGGRISIETGNVAIGSDQAPHYPEVKPGPYVMVAVSDNGEGIPPEILPRVFDPFFTTKEVGRGSGLGLSQVYGFARESGGHAAIYSEPGVGTTVRLYLPAHEPLPHPEEPVREAAASPAVPPKGEGTVLVVEDDEAVRSIAVETLADAGYRVLAAANAFEALEILRGGQPIDLMFSDVVMPGGMNGLQLGAEVRRLRPQVRIMITSGYTRDALAVQHGFDSDFALLSKPYQPSELVARTAALLAAPGRGLGRA
ncbi:hybrid sensor histidine kinase/response regulator [Rhodovastum atsumiense]|uniref:histidine kinase n=1 Tax=Rhodovastum atsumiense TaxID=504468 RepID=A0A5M6IPU7_9PROT|nr:hybrid sensor histidine kinase/response regulator [Rhodovastum atsumiense]KAA5610266.1 response regulator [Rhodovastum atsumiense]